MASFDREGGAGQGPTPQLADAGGGAAQAGEAERERGKVLTAYVFFGNAGAGGAAGAGGTAGGLGEEIIHVLMASLKSAPNRRLARAPIPRLACAKTRGPPRRWWLSAQRAERLC
mgnify:FL=1|jgi:hypothetical protein